MSDVRSDPVLDKALSARVRGEIDFVLEIAKVRHVPWEAAIAVYSELFKREAATVLERVAAARARRKSTE